MPRRTFARSEVLPEGGGMKFVRRGFIDCFF